MTTQNRPEDNPAIHEACPVCAAQKDERCRDLSDLGLAHGEVLDYLHAERIDSAAFADAVNHLGEQGSTVLPLTTAMIDATGLV